MVYSLNPTTGVFVTFGAASAVSTAVLLATARYMIVTDTAVIIAQAAVTPVAAKADGSTLVVPGIPLIVSGRNGAKIATLQAGGSGGQLTITRLED